MLVGETSREARCSGGLFDLDANVPSTIGTQGTGLHRVAFQLESREDWSAN
jgi:hypothetical protein